MASPCRRPQTAGGSYLTARTVEQGGPDCPDFAESRHWRPFLAPGLATNNVLNPEEARRSILSVFLRHKKLVVGSGEMSTVETDQMLVVWMAEMFAVETEQVSSVGWSLDF